MPFHVCYLFTFVDCFEILTCLVFLHSVCSVCFIRRCIFQVIRKKKKKSSSASVLTLIILLSLLFLKRLCFTPKYINFVYSYVAYVAFIFLLVFAARISVLLLLFFFFSHEEHEDMPLSWKMILFWIFRCFRSEIW